MMSTATRIERISMAHMPPVAVSARETGSGDDAFGKVIHTLEARG